MPLSPFSCGCACNFGIDQTACEITFPGGHSFVACGGKSNGTEEPRLAVQLVRNQASARGDNGAVCNWCGSVNGDCGCEEALLARLAAYDPNIEDLKTSGPRSSGKELALPNCSRDDGASIGFEAAEKPDFSGKWGFTRTDSSRDEWEALMLDAGVAWSTRKMAHGASYGIGLQTQTIEQNGDSFKIGVSNGFMTTNMQFVVDGTEQATISEDGNDVIITPVWEGAVLKITGKLKSNGKPIQPSVRYMRGSEMVLEATASTGEVVNRNWQKK